MDRRFRTRRAEKTVPNCARRTTVPPPNCPPASPLQRRPAGSRRRQGCGRVMWSARSGSPGRGAARAWIWMVQVTGIQRRAACCSNRPTRKKADERTCLKACESLQQSHGRRRGAEAEAEAVAARQMGQANGRVRTGLDTDS